MSVRPLNQSVGEIAADSQFAVGVPQITRISAGRPIHIDSPIIHCLTQDASSPHIAPRCHTREQLEELQR